MTRQEIINLIEKYNIKVIGDKVGGNFTNEIINTIKENKQQIINIYTEELGIKEEERKARIEARRIERMKKLYSNQEQRIIITKKYDGTITVENNADEILGIENIDIEGLKKYAAGYEDGNSYYELTVAELKTLAIEKEEVTEAEKTELEKEIERLAEIAKETSKPQILEEEMSWDPSKGIPVKHYKLVNKQGEVYIYTEDLEK